MAICSSTIVQPNWQRHQVHSLRDRRLQENNKNLSVTSKYEDHFKINLWGKLESSVIPRKNLPPPPPHEKKERKVCFFSFGNVPNPKTFLILLEEIITEIKGIHYTNIINDSTIKNATVWHFFLLSLELKKIIKENK